MKDEFIDIDDADIELNCLYAVHLQNDEYALAKAVLDTDLKLVLEPSGVAEFSFGDVEFSAPIKSIRKFS